LSFGFIFFNWFSFKHSRSSQVLNKTYNRLVREVLSSYYDYYYYIYYENMIITIILLLLLLLLPLVL